MIANSVKAIWEDFRCQVIDPKDFSPETVEFIQHVFYSAFDACLLEIFALPHIYHDDHEKVANGLAGLLDEAQSYFSRQGMEPVKLMSIPIAGAVADSDGGEPD